MKNFKAVKITVLEKYLEIFQIMNIIVMLFFLYSWGEDSDTRTCGSSWRG